MPTPKGHAGALAQGSALSRREIPAYSEASREILGHRLGWSARHRRRACEPGRRGRCVGVLPDVLSGAARWPCRVPAHWAGVGIAFESVDISGYRFGTPNGRRLSLRFGGSEARADRMDAQMAASQREPPHARQFGLDASRRTIQVTAADQASVRSTRTIQIRAARQAFPCPARGLTSSSRLTQPLPSQSGQ